jgi:hypothetical protein
MHRLVRSSPVSRATAHAGRRRQPAGSRARCARMHHCPRAAGPQQPARASQLLPAWPARARVVVARATRPRAACVASVLGALDIRSRQQARPSLRTYGTGGRTRRAATIGSCFRGVHRCRAAEGALSPLADGTRDGRRHDGLLARHAARTRMHIARTIGLLEDPRTGLDRSSRGRVRAHALAGLVRARPSCAKHRCHGEKASYVRTPAVWCVIDRDTYISLVIYIISYPYSRADLKQNESKAILTRMDTKILEQEHLQGTSW